MSSSLSISFLESGIWGWTSLDSTNYRESTIIFHLLCLYHIPHFICLSVSPRSKRLLSRMTYDDSHYQHDSPLSGSEFALNKPSQFLFLTNTVPLLYLYQFSHSVVSDSLQPYGLQHARLPCVLPTPRTCSNSCPSCWWCHPTILSSIAPFFSFLQYFLQFFSNFLSNIWFWNWSQSSMKEGEYLYLFTNILLI